MNEPYLEIVQYQGQNGGFDTRKDRQRFRITIKRDGCDTSHVLTDGHGVDLEDAKNIVRNWIALLGCSTRYLVEVIKSTRTMEEKGSFDV